MPAPIDPCDVSPYLVMQNFETPVTGYDHCDIWLETKSGTIDPAYTGVVLQGAQSLRMTNIASFTQAYTSNFVAQAEIWAYCLIRPIRIDSGSIAPLFWFRRADLNGTCNVYINTSGTIRIVGSGLATSVGAMAVDTTYHCWFHYKKGTGANAIVDFAFSTTGIRPTSGDFFVQLTGQTMTVDTAVFSIGRDTDIFTSEYIFDKVRVDDVQIGNDPP